MSRFFFDAPSHDATRRLAAALGEALPEPMVVALCGTLGAGKTFLVRAIAESLGIPADQVVSPTFVLCQEYHGRKKLIHSDAYRLRDEDEFLDLGIEERFETPCITLIEWADRVQGVLPEDFLEIRIEHTGDEARRFELIGHGERSDAVVNDVADRLPNDVFAPKGQR